MSAFNKKPPSLKAAVLKLASFARADKHAQRVNTDRGAAMRAAPYTITDAMMEQHLGNGPWLHIYPLHKDNTYIGVIDFDDHDESAGWSFTAKAALRVSSELKRKGIKHFQVRSGGGHGVHLWLVWRGPQSARNVRRLMQSTLSSAGLKVGTAGVSQGVAEIFPKQDVAGEKGGNCVSLPFGRDSVPLAADCATSIPWDQYVPFDLSYLANDDIDPSTLPPEPSPSKSKPRDPPPVSVIRELLKHIDAGDYDTWIKVGFILRAYYPDDGWELWFEWSEGAANASNQQDCWRKWQGFPDTGTVGPGTLFHLAKQGGWQGSERAILEEINQRYGILAMGNKTQIIDKQPLRGDDQPIHLIGVATLKDRLAGEPAIGFGNSAQARGEWWLEQEGAARYHDLVFDPSLPPGDNGLTWNSWRGFAVTPARGDWSLMKAFILEVIASGNEKRAAWVLNWMAWVVQNPSMPIGTAMVLMGLPGIGKTFFCKAFGHLWGVHSITLTSREHVTGRFNSHLGGRRFVTIDEGMFGGDRSNAGVLKTRLTDKTLVFEQKGVDGITMPNRMAFIVASNEDSVVAADRRERRWNVFEVSAIRQEDHAYFEAIQAELDNGGYEAMLFDLMARDWTEGPSPLSITRGHAIFEQWITSAAAEYRYIHALLDDGGLPQGGMEGGVQTTARALWVDMKARIPDHRYSSEALLPKRLRECLGPLQTTSGGLYIDPHTGQRMRSTAYFLPDLPECRRRFAVATGFKIDWTSNDGWQMSDTPTKVPF